MAESRHELAFEWVVWEHPKPMIKGDWPKPVELCRFSTIEGFWGFFNSFPKPSDCFRGAHRFVDGREVDAWSIFKSGVSPEWEDKTNKSGITCRCGLPPYLLNETWKNLLMALAGETLDDGDEICGARIVNKSSATKNIYRFELWMKSRTEEANEAHNIIKERLKTLVEIESRPLNWEISNF